MKYVFHNYLLIFRYLSPTSIQRATLIEPSLPTSMAASAIFCLKFILQLTLLAVFLIFFGSESLSKYSEKKVLVVESKNETARIPSPAVTICGRNSTGGRLKTLRRLDSALWACNESDNVFNCMEKNAVGFNDMILDARKGHAKENLMKEIFWTSTFPDEGACFSLNIQRMITANFSVDRIVFNLNKNLSYVMYIHSADYFVQNLFSLVLPINRMKILSDNCNSYISLSMVQHHKLDTHNEPCKDDQDYSFTSCIEDSVARQVGCRLRQGHQATDDKVCTHGLCSIYSDYLQSF